MELLLFVLRVLLGLPAHTPDELAPVAVHPDGRTSSLREGPDAECSAWGTTDGDKACQRLIAPWAGGTSAPRFKWTLFLAAGFRPRRR